MQNYPENTRYYVGFWSRSLNPTERNYSTGERECLDVALAIQVLCLYLEHQHFELYTDHQAIKWILYLAEANGRQERWRLSLLEFDFKFYYRKGGKNTIADAISRLPTWGYSNIVLDIEITCFAITDLSR